MKKLNLKKLLSLTAAVALTLSLAACLRREYALRLPRLGAGAESTPAAGGL